MMYAGLSCYIGQYIFGYCIGSNVSKQDAIDFTLLYLYVDYYFDGGGISFNILPFIQAVYQPEDVTSFPIPHVLETYKRILSRHPDPSCKQKMIDVFMTEIEGVRYQSSPNMTESQYMDIAVRKGGTTTVAIASMMSSNNNFTIDLDSIYLIGAIVQLLDDMLDVYEDMNLNINTIATYQLKTYDNLDKLLLHTLNQISLLPSKYSLIKSIMCLVSLYIVGYHDTNAFSLTTMRELRPWIIHNMKKSIVDILS